MISILGYALVLIMTVLVYRAAQRNNRPGLVWALCNVAVGVVIQIAGSFLVMKLIISSLMDPGSGRLGVDGLENLKMYANYAGIAGVALSLIAMFIIQRLASRRG